MSHAKLRQESINRSDLCPGSPTAISQISGVNVIVAIGDEERYCGKPIQYLRPGFRTRKALKDLLEHEACCNDRLARFNCSDQRLHFRHPRRRIAPQRKRPNTRANEKGQSRRRSAL
jgi:hypothetical protein